MHCRAGRPAQAGQASVQWHSDLQANRYRYGSDNILPPYRPAQPSRDSARGAVTLPYPPPEACILAIRGFLYCTSGKWEPAIVFAHSLATRALKMAFATNANEAP